MENKDIKSFFQSKRNTSLYFGASILMVTLVGFGIWYFYSQKTSDSLEVQLGNLEFDKVIPIDSSAGAQIASVPAPVDQAEQKAQEERKEIIKDQARKSPYYATAIKQSDKGADIDCNAILSDYEQEIEKSVQNNKISDKLMQVQNDLLLEKCKNDPAFMKRFMEVYNKLDKIQE